MLGYIVDPSLFYLGAESVDDSSIRFSAVTY